MLELALLALAVLSSAYHFVRGHHRPPGSTDGGANARDRSVLNMGRGLVSASSFVLLAVAAFILVRAIYRLVT